MSKNEAAKRSFIKADFRNLERRIKLTRSLEEQDAEAEARLLYFCYIEGIGSWLYREQKGPAEIFVRVLREHGGEPFLLSGERRVWDSVPLP